MIVHSRVRPSLLWYLNAPPYCNLHHFNLINTRHPGVKASMTALGCHPSQFQCCSWQHLLRLCSWPRPWWLVQVVNTNLYKHATALYHSFTSHPMLMLEWWCAQVHLAQMGLKVFQAQQKLEQMDKDQKQRSEAKARLSQQPPSPIAGPSATPAAGHQQPGGCSVSLFSFLAPLWRWHESSRGATAGNL